ncbi:spore germination protein [Brevibacillus sp. NRS-1366]|uniref:spore germination protein n=1 Tax=Brevibacillus sp. NRS-1366 TaxID=3233899 RepID=UPI003D1C62CC
MDKERGKKMGEADLRMEEQLSCLKEQLANCSDAVFHVFEAGFHQKCALIYLSVMIDLQSIQEEVLSPILSMVVSDQAEFRERIFERKQLPVSNFRVISLEQGVNAILGGSALLLMDQERRVVEFPLASVKGRSIDEPANEATVRGPRESFIESADDNLSLIRKRLKTPDFKTETMQIGRLTQTKVMIAYIQGLCQNEWIEEVRTVLSQIEIDGVLGSSYLEELFDSSPFSPFPQVQYTERPDVVSAALLEGRLAVIVDGTPMVLLVPVTLFMLLQSAEDYYQRFIAGTWIRWIRYLFAFISLLLPSFYIAITTFHPEMIPPKLLITITASREVVPFPALIEAFIMEISFEALREAAVRIPKSIGQAVSIIGALIIGTAAVQAGIVSAAMVIIVSFTGIASFIIPHYDLGLAFRFLRFPIMILAGGFGLFGIACGLIILYIHLINLRSLGLPYLTPITPFVASDLKDTLVRAPWWSMKKRPYQVHRNKIRQKNLARRLEHEQEENGD